MADAYSFGLCSLGLIYLSRSGWGLGPNAGRHFYRREASSSG